MGFLKRLVLPGWMPFALTALPYIAFAALVAAYLFQRQQLAVTVRERDRIIRVFDPSGKASPDQAIALAQGALMERDAATSALTVTTRNYRLATAKAQAADLIHARAVESRDAATNGKVQHDLEKQLAGARADADAYAVRLRARDAATAVAVADRGGGGAAGVSGPAESASRAALPGPATQLDDVRACAAGITLAAGWQRWWAEVSAVAR